MFLPDPSVVSGEADRAMRVALVESLRHVHASGLTLAPERDGQVAAGLDDLLSHRVSPGVFGRYYDLVFAVQAKRYDDARRLLGEILVLGAEPARLAILPFTEAALGADVERYGRLMDLSADEPALLAAPEPEGWRSFEDNVRKALVLIEEAEPALAAELRGLVVQIVGASPPARGATRVFGGASSFMLWGAVFLNVARHATPLKVAEGLIHEAAHQLLFARSREDALVENPVADRFASPLRPDGRPMIGVYHATFVCARMHYVCERLRQAGPSLLAADDLATVEHRLAALKRAYADGHETVRSQGRLTALGARIMADTADYMRAAA